MAIEGSASAATSGPTDRRGRRHLRSARLSTGRRDPAHTDRPDHGTV